MKYIGVNDIKRIKTWGRLIGIGSMLYGVVSIVLSFYTSFWYVIPAILSIFIGKLLFDIGHEAKKVQQADGESIGIVQPVLKKYSTFLFAFSIIIIVTLASYLAFLGYIYIFY